MQHKDQTKPFQELLTQIQQGSIAAVYLLHGPEQYLGRKIEQAIIENWLTPDARMEGIVVFDGDPSPEQLRAEVESVSMFVTRRVIIIRRSQVFKAKRNKTEGESGKTAAELYLPMIKELPKEIKLIIGCEEKADKRLKLYQLVERSGKVLELSSPRPYAMSAWLEQQLRERGKKLDGQAQQLVAQMLSLLPGITLDALDQEAEKLAVYCGNNPVIRRTEIAEIFQPAANEGGPLLFLLLDRWLEKDCPGMLKVWQQAVKTVDDGFHLLRLWGQEVRSLLEVKGLKQQGATTHDIIAKFHWLPFVAEKKVRHAAGFSRQELEQLLLGLGDIECNVKGKSGDLLAQLEMLLITSRSSG